MTPAARRRILAVAALSVLACAAPARAAPAPLLAAAGDISCAPDAGPFVPFVRCGQGATARLVAAADPAAVAVLGDIQYEAGLPAEYAAPGRFTDTWGAFRPRIRPVPGNHEYAVHADTAASYFDYFNGPGRATGPAGDRTRGGFYSYELGTWHVVALNSSCSAAGACADSITGSTWREQTDWLRADLAAHRGQCVLAYWHHPLFTSGDPSGGVRPSPGVRPLLQALYDARADVVLNGHAHNYERFARRDPSGALDPAGVRTFVVGTGGDDLLGFGPPTTGSEQRAYGDFGVLLLRLRPGAYDWRFEQVNDRDRDAGSSACHARPAPAAADARAALRAVRGVLRGGGLRTLLRRGAVGFGFRPALAGRLAVTLRSGATVVARARAAGAGRAVVPAVLRVTAAGRRLLRARRPAVLQLTATVGRDGAPARSARLRLLLRR